MNGVPATNPFYSARAGHAAYYFGSRFDILDGNKIALFRDHGLGV